MEIDYFSVLLFNSLISITLFISLSFYQKTQKTYPGFGYWAGGTFIVVFGYTSIWTWELLQIGWLMILVSRLAFSLAAFLRLEGSIRFLRGKSLHRALYLVPVIFAVTGFSINKLPYGYLIETFIRVIMFCTLGVVTARLFFKYARSYKPGLYWFVGSLFLLFGLAQLVFAFITILGYILHIDVFDNLNNTFFLFNGMFEVAWGIGYMMMNGQRLESDLNASKQELSDTVKELQSAMSEIKTLSGLVPICSHCKSIRDDQGYWNQLEAYLIKHSDAKFSHGICPDCARELYPDLVPKTGKEAKEVD